MADITDDDAFDDIAEKDPEAIILMFKMIVDEADDLGGDDFMGLATAAASEGVNIFRIMLDHPDLTRKAFDIDPSRLDTLAEKFDDAIRESQ